MQISNVESRFTSHAFTAKDLVAVLACLSILVVVQIAALGNTTGRGRLTQCMANLQQMGRAWLMYAADNNGKVVWNPDGGDAGKVATKPSWAGGWLDFSNNNTDNTNTSFLMTHTTPSSYGGLLGPYLSSPSVFRCPEDSSAVTIFGQKKPRVRNISMNCYIGGQRPDGGLNSFALPPFRVFRTVDDFVKLKPASAFVFIDEREDSVNDAAFQMNLTQALDALDNITESGQTINDLPADWHDMGTTLSFADGHSEYWRWTDSRMSPRRPYSRLNPSSPFNQDIARLAKATSSH